MQSSAFWHYDTAPNGIGNLDYVQDTVSGYIQALAYDSLGRLSQVGTSLSNNDNYFQRVTYDSVGRIHQEYDPGGTTSGIERVYKPNGYLQKIVDTATQQPYYTVAGMDARGNIVQELIGAINTTRSYDPSTGRLINTNSSAPGLNSIQSLGYQYDAVGNVLRRSDSLKSISENFHYDELDRLDCSEVAALAATTCNPSAPGATGISYDSFGNILSKTGVGNYGYGNGAGPHAVTSITGSAAANYTYDANGNNLSGAGRALKYSIFDKPTSITRGTTTTRFTYDPGRSLYRRTDTTNGQVTSSVSLGNFEKVTHPDGQVEVRRYLPAAMITKTYSATGVLQNTSNLALLKDHLGSIDVIVDQNGDNVGGTNTIKQTQSFDAWGQRRNAADWAALSEQQLAAFDHATTYKGFTGHEMLDEAGIIHMRGRIYDPKLGRFLQADPYVQEPGNPQNYNRYSYVINNPLSYTDPSGFYLADQATATMSRSEQRMVMMIVASGGDPGLNVIRSSVGSVAYVGAISSGLSSGSVGGNTGSVVKNGASDLSTASTVVVQASTSSGQASQISPKIEQIIVQSTGRKYDPPAITWTYETSSRYLGMQPRSQFDPRPIEAYEVSITPKVIYDGTSYHGMEVTWAQMDGAMEGRLQMLAETSASMIPFERLVTGGVWLVRAAKTAKESRALRAVEGQSVTNKVAPNAEQAANLERFLKKVPANARDDVQLRNLPNGGVAGQAISPGRVPGSKAVYEKQIDATGKTVQYTKTTYGPDGEIIHVKDKVNGGAYP